MILDTNAISALFGGDPALAEVLAPAERHEVPVVVLGEYRFGLRRSRQRKQLERLLVTLTQEIPGNGVWIAALAVEHNLPVVSRDEHFDNVEDLTRVAW